jgi:hypothetical protein
VNLFRAVEEPCKLDSSPPSQQAVELVEETVSSPPPVAAVGLSWRVCENANASLA